MNDEWIEIALLNEAVMTVSYVKKQYRATMNWRHCESVSGEGKDTITEAVESLNQQLLDDAAEEMADAGVV